MTHDEYMSLTSDLSGSLSKNRFRLELLWGVSKMLDLMEEDKDFTMVFDYVCDIEIHYESEYEFYQIKSHGINAPAYTSKSLTKKASPDAEGSIVGKLYKLNIQNDERTKLFLVTNTPYSCNRKKIDDEYTCFDSFPDKDMLQEALCTELGISNVSLANMFYLYTHMNLQNPAYEIQGKIVISFVKIKGCEPQNPTALYRLITDSVSEKACYEFPSNDYGTLILNKGITRNEFDRFLNCHAVNEKTGIKQAQEFINLLPNIAERKAYKKSLAKLLPMMANNRILCEFEREISSYLAKQTDLGNIQSIINMLTETFHSQFPIEYDDADKTVFYLIVVHKFVEGAYDNENDI